MDDVTAGRIAAGEVVERPASVAKELVENALDAGATRVEVEIGDGGRDLVRVADDGEGMDAADARLAFERHATSKLGTADELDGILTYGFRGEALPSIAAVAKVRLLTATRGAQEGSEIVCEGGRLVSLRPGPARKGTVIWVRDLFFNTPARRAGLRSAPTEAARIAEVVGTLALAAPGVAVNLSADSGFLWGTPGAGRLEDAAASLFGTEFVRRTIGVEWGPGADGVRVTGLAGLPVAARRDGKRQYLFCNGRPVNPHLLRGAVEEAYRGLLEAGRTPVFILEVALPPGAVDVNIHPAKTFVRFRDHGRVHRAVLTALRSALKDGDLFTGRLRNGLVKPPQATVREVAAATGLGGGIPAEGGAVRLLPEAGTLLAAEGAVPADASRATAALDPAALEPLGQVGGLFMVARAPDGLYVIDQHAAHERIVYERLLSAADVAGLAPTQPPGQRGAAQVLAVPEALHLAPGEEEALTRSLGFLRAVGFDIEAFGAGAALVRAVPAILTGVPTSRLLGDFLDRVDDAEVRPRGEDEPGRDAIALSASGGGGPALDLARAARIMAACKAALKAGQGLTLDDMRALLCDLAATREPRTCPHGRPTHLRLGLGELRQAFGRRATGPRRRLSGYEPDAKGYGKE